MHFSHLYGNELAKTFLKSSITGSRVLLFSGPIGLGKRSFAIAFLQNLLGQKHAKKIIDEVHPDIKWIRPEGKTRMHPVASIKEMIEDAALSPFESTRKVYVIEEAERMLPASSNTLLKTLEEPPSHVSFILLTSHEEEMLPTILSRCVRVPFYPIEEEVLINALGKSCDSPEKAKQVAMASLGSFSKAQEILKGAEDPIYIHFMEILKKYFLTRPSIGLIEALEALDKLIEKRSKDEDAVSQVLDKLFDDLLFWARDLHYKKIDPNSGNLFHSDCQADLDRQLQGKLPSLEKVSSLVEEARFAIQRHSKAKAVLERLFYQITESTRWA